MKTIFFLLFLGYTLGVSAQKNYDKMRKSMVDQQIEARGVDHRATLEAMKKVERHLFVPDDWITLAYTDRPLPIGHGQTISQPYIVGYMTSYLRPKKAWKVLEIGTGSGYQAAVLAEIVESVYSIEIIPALGETAKERFANMGYQNVFVRIGDGFYGWEEQAPFDAIVVTAASDIIPPPLIAQLKDGGKMIIPVGSPFMTQYLVLVTKQGEKVKTKNLLPVRFVPFTGDH